MSYACLQQRPTDILRPRAASTGERRTGIREIPANALLAQLVEHFHGKEGVVGSSPTEGSEESPVLAGFWGRAAEALVSFEDAPEPQATAREMRSFRWWLLNAPSPSALELLLLFVAQRSTAIELVSSRLNALCNPWPAHMGLRAIRSSQRAGDSAFRVGGDEFAVVLTSTRCWGALEFVQRLDLELESLERGASVTAGIAEALNTRDKDELIREADLPLIGAKRINQQAAIYSPDMHASVEAGIAEDEHHTQTLANALALAVDAKDSYTRSHCQTVAQLSVVIAMELDIDRERLVRIRLAGLRHDVGKIGVPDSILQKPAPLTHDEYEQMKGHSVLGAAIVEAAEMPLEAHWVRHHHERIDGTGYPDGRAGDETPLESRIIHVADAYEAMTSNRPYREAPGQSYAIEQLRHHSGTQFDRDVVEALIRRLDATGARPEVQDLPALNTTPAAALVRQETN